jgi:two-component system, response regulator PdtaR
MMPPAAAARHPARGEAVFARADAARGAKSPADAVPLLIVEDDYLVAAEMEDSLSQAGFQIVGIAGSADEALKFAAATRPALVIMDIRLRGKRDGIDAALELFSRYGIRVVFATAHQTADARQRAAAANPLAWVPKPYTQATLIDVVRRALRELNSRQ